MRIFHAIFLSFFMTSCSSKSYDPQAQIDIRSANEVQIEILEAIKVFGSKNGFDVGYRDTLPKQGRFVSQATVRRSDGVVVSTSNFMKPDTLQTFFYAEKPDADWRSVKEAWLKVVTETLNGRGEITEILVGPSPHLTDEKPKSPAQ